LTSKRIFVAATVQIGPVARRIELGLVDREHMLYRMLLGRMALGRGVLGRPQSPLPATPWIDGSARRARVRAPQREGERP
jgi:hypothetical protein